MGNLDIWDAVSVTNPHHTKRVNQRGGFTAIDAHYQIQMATEQFGPVGIGWGYICGDLVFQSDCVIVPVTLWHGDRGNTFGPWYGCAVMAGNRIDADAPKKATTDAITKALSHLGFNADVFLGKFDDNKYVESLKAESATAAQRDGLKDAWAQGVLDRLGSNPSPRQKADAFAMAIIEGLKSKSGIKALNAEWSRRQTFIDRFEKTYPDLHGDVLNAFATQKSTIEQKEDA